MSVRTFPIPFAALFLIQSLSSCQATPPTVLQPQTQPLSTSTSPSPTSIPPIPTRAPTAIPNLQPTDLPTAYPPTIIPELFPSDPSGQTVIFWHAWGFGSKHNIVLDFVREFNASNPWGIRVEVVPYERLGDLEDAMDSAIQSNEYPNMVVAYGNTLAGWLESGMLVNLNQFFDDPVHGYTTNEIRDILPAALKSPLTNEGVRVGFPLSLSANVLFYNQSWAKELGFPNLPNTPEELTIQACAAAHANTQDGNRNNDGTGGLVLYPSASNIMSWIFAFGSNGRDTTGTGYYFASPETRDVAGFLKNLWDAGCAFQTADYPNPEFASRKALFTMSSTAGLPFQLEAFQESDAFKDEWSVMAFPGREGHQAVNVFTQAVGIMNTTPEQNLASWLFLKYLSEPEVQAQWVDATCYYPTLANAISLSSSPIISDPRWRTGFDLLRYGQFEPVVPSWGVVRQYVQETFEEILTRPANQIDLHLMNLDIIAAEIAAGMDQ